MRTVTYYLTLLMLLPVILEAGITFAAIDVKETPDDCKVSALELKQQYHLDSNGQRMPLYQSWGTGIYSTKRCFPSHGHPQKLISCVESCRSDDAYTFFAACKGMCSDYHKCFVINSTSPDAPSPRFCADRFPDDVSLPPEPSSNVTSFPTARTTETSVRKQTKVEATDAGYTLHTLSPSIQDDSYRITVIGGIAGGVAVFCVLAMLTIFGVVYKCRIKKNANNNNVSTGGDPENGQEMLPLSPSQVTPAATVAEGDTELADNSEDIRPVEDGMNTITVFNEFTNTPGTQVASKLEQFYPMVYDDNNAATSSRGESLLNSRDSEEHENGHDSILPVCSRHIRRD